MKPRVMALANYVTSNPMMHPFNRRARRLQIKEEEYFASCDKEGCR
jgi:hypothetical protein